MSLSHYARSRTKSTLENLKEELNYTYNSLRGVESIVDINSVTEDPSQFGQLMIQIIALKNLAEQTLDSVNKKTKKADRLSDLD
jgi:hypothetical protein